MRRQRDAWLNQCRPSKAMPPQRNAWQDDATQTNDTLQMRKYQKTTMKADILACLTEPDAVITPKLMRRVSEAVMDTRSKRDSPLSPPPCDQLGAGTGIFTAHTASEARLTVDPTVQAERQEGSPKSSTPTLVRRIQRGLDFSGLTQSTATVEAIIGSGADQCCLWSSKATLHLTGLLDITGEDVVLDVGCGLGGRVRQIAVQCPGAQVCGTQCNTEQAEAAQAINKWPAVAAQLQGRASIANGSLREIADESVTKAIVSAGMGVREKVLLARQLCRVLRPGGSVALLEVVATKEEGGFGHRGVNRRLRYPLPWADEAAESWVCHAKSYQVAFEASGFNTTKMAEHALSNIRDAEATNMNELTQHALEQLSAAAPLGAHLCLGGDVNAKRENLRAGLASGDLAIAEMVFTRKGSGNCCWSPLRHVHCELGDIARH